MAGGAPVGNKNAQRAKEFEGFLRRALARDDWKRLNDGMEKLAEAVGSGERWAIELVRDTLDGKPKQTLEADITQTNINVDLGKSDSLENRLRAILDKRSSQPVGDTVQ